MSYKFAEEIASETIGFVVTPVTVVSPSRALFSLMLFLPLRISDFFCIIQAWEIPQIDSSLLLNLAAS